MSSAANTVNSYPFSAGREDKSPSVPIWSEVDTRTHILNKDMANYKALVDSNSSQIKRAFSTDRSEFITVRALNGIAAPGVL
jgi:hypothetical protein